PEAQAIDGAAPVAGHQVVVGDAQYRVIGSPAEALIALPIGPAGDLAAEADRDGQLGVGQLPGVAKELPVVGVLDLPAVGETLAEDAILVIDAVAYHRQAEGGSGVEVAGG